MKALIYFSLLLIAGICKSQSVGFDTIQYFDADKYEDWEIDNAYVVFPFNKYLKKGDERVIITFSEEKIQIEKSNITSPYKITYVYSVKSKHVLSILKEFYSCYVGIYKKYDEAGKLILEENQDEFYKISVEDLVQVLKQELNIDLLDMTKKISVSRNTEPTPQYTITIPQHPLRVLRWIKVDAITGKILSDEIKTPPNKYTSEWRDNQNEERDTI